MKKRIVTVAAMLLAAACIVCLWGCAAGSPELLDEKVGAMIDADAARDAERSFSMIYPGAADREAYDAAAEAIFGYFPVTADYSAERQQWNVSKGLFGGSEVYNGQYRVEFGERVFYIYAVWRSDKNGSGFTQFQIVSEEDMLAAQST